MVIVDDLSYMKTIRFLQKHGANINHIAVTQQPGNSKSIKLTDISVRSLMSVVGERARLELCNTSDDNSR